MYKVGAAECESRRTDTNQKREGMCRDSARLLRYTRTVGASPGFPLPGERYAKEVQLCTL
jgi:hypothetical protein